MASFPPIQSAIKVSGTGDGMRIQLDIPETEMGNAAMLLAWRQCRLQVTVEALFDDTTAQSMTAKQSHDFTLIDGTRAHDG
jgi:hypothetical protein